MDGQRSRFRIVGNALRSTQHPPLPVKGSGQQKYISCGCGLHPLRATKRRRLTMPSHSPAPGFPGASLSGPNMSVQIRERQASSSTFPGPTNNDAFVGGDVLGRRPPTHVCAPTAPPLTVSACCFLCRVSVSAFGAMLPVPAASLSSFPFHSSGGVPAACGNVAHECGGEGRNTIRRWGGGKPTNNQAVAVSRPCPNRGTLVEEKRFEQDQQNYSIVPKPKTECRQQHLGSFILFFSKKTKTKGDRCRGGAIYAVVRPKTGKLTRDPDVPVGAQDHIDPGVRQGHHVLLQSSDQYRRHRH